MTYISFLPAQSAMLKIAKTIVNDVTNNVGFGFLVSQSLIKISKRWLPQQGRPPSLGSQRCIIQRTIAIISETLLKGHSEWPLSFKVFSTELFEEYSSS